MIYILLSTYNGSEYLDEFLDSLLSQSMNAWKLLARDDGSLDSTKAILNAFAVDNPNKVEFISDDANLGASSSFGRLLSKATDKSECEYMMFADQDDVWLPDKISKAYSRMQELESKYGKDIPILVHTDLHVVNSELNIIDKSFWHYQHLLPNLQDLNHLFMQNNITGCTMMINRRLAEIATPIPDEAIMHDWWMGLAASAFGKISYIKDADILYRQHGANDTGAKSFNLVYIVKQAYALLTKGNTIDKNIAQAKAFLRQYEDSLGESDKKMLTDFCNIKEYSFWKKRYILFRHRLFKQGIIRNIGLLLRV